MKYEAKIVDAHSRNSISVLEFCKFIILIYNLN